MKVLSAKQNMKLNITKKDLRLLYRIKWKINNLIANFNKNSY